MKNRINLSGMTNDVRHPSPGHRFSAAFAAACAAAVLLMAGTPPAGPGKDRL